MKILILGLMIILFSNSFIPVADIPAKNTGTLKLIFLNSANGKSITLRDSIYKNDFGEFYSISKLKYYISNLTLLTNGRENNLGGYFLMNVQTEEKSFELQVQPGRYNKMEFLLGVDSIRNCSGAQTGALDPMNDMFWTWNSGYVMFKLEGNSTASTADQNRIEHHVGGYKGSNNVATKIDFNFTAEHLLEIRTNGTTEILIEANLDKYWHDRSEIRISESPVCTTTGELAKKISANFKNMFTIKSMHTYP